jgi:uncharacterized membrane protein YvbJ
MKTPPVNMPRKKKPKAPPLFYCDNCGAQVGQDEPACPRCGRKFASIRCPACGYSGEEKQFDDGCPKCGYQVIPGKGVHRNKGRGSRGHHGYVADKKEALPVWCYILTLAFFFLVFSFLLFYLSR